MAGRTTKRRRPNGSPNAPVRSVRVVDEVWNRAKRRAASEGTTMSDVLALFTEGYASGMINPPARRTTLVAQPVVVDQS